MSLFKHVKIIFFFIIISALSSVVYADVPPTSCMATAETENELSLAHWAEQEASMVMCAHGYWAEKCGAHKTANIIFDRCIDAGYVGAMIWKSLLYEEGNGVPQDSVKATDLLRRAALSDDKDYATLGKLHYATALYLGRGTERNVDEAMKWFREAADEGDSDAQEFLRTGSHAADRDLKGRSVGLQYEAKKLGETNQASEAKQSLAQHLIPVANDVPLVSEPQKMTGKIIWLLIIILILIVIGALYQAIRSHQLLNKDA